MKREEKEQNNRQRRYLADVSSLGARKPQLLSLRHRRRQRQKQTYLMKMSKERVLAYRQVRDVTVSGQRLETSRTRERLNKQSRNTRPGRDERKEPKESTP